MLVLNYAAGHGGLSMMELDDAAIKGVSVCKLYSKEQVDKTDLQRKF